MEKYFLDKSKVINKTKGEGRKNYDPQIPAPNPENAPKRKEKKRKKRKRTSKIKDGAKTNYKNQHCLTKYKPCAKPPNIFRNKKRYRVAS